MTERRRKVQVWIHRASEDGELEVLLLKTNPKRGSFWQPVTGSVEDGESFEEAALREAREETSLPFSEPPRDLGYEFQFESKWGPAHERVFALLVPAGPSRLDAALHIDPSEHSDARWLRADEALNLLRFPSNAQGLRILMKSWGNGNKTEAGDR